jgi:hypothetical protein
MNPSIELRTEMIENDIDLRPRGWTFLQPQHAPRVASHERRCSGMHLFTVEMPEAKLPKLLSKV